ncbi:MAG: DUF2188 domain-containing protein [Candidatus Absconditabacteria bacterium]|nr:DUF2188 domain-containing protein [Candidatus Absconditabacteria bacterium]
MSKQVRVSPNPSGGWRVHKSGSQRDSLHTDTKLEAVSKAESIARNRGGETKIQNMDGKISGGNSYGNDPFPPKG